jgi:hypothetical protein
MITAMNLAGSLAAHAIWSVSDGEILVPILGFTDQDDERVMNRLVAADLAEAVQRKGCEDFDMDQALQAFWDGVSSHEQANEVWTDALDESI